MRLRPTLRIPELLEIWAAERKPSRQTEHETRRSVTELMDLHGDVAVSAVTRDMLLDYRDQSKRLP